MVKGSIEKLVKKIEAFEHDKAPKNEISLLLHLRDKKELTALREMQNIIYYSQPNKIIDL
jgi:hypothetical protein